MTTSSKKWDTKVIKVDPANLKDEDFQYAAELLQKGELVAFPTETVYGLGANALDDEASKKIYAAKNRPADNPLIVHISHIEMLSELVAEVPKRAQILIDKFWPGPLTMLFKKSSKVSATVTCGLETVAVRFPSHPVCKKLLSMSGVPVAAPSANLSGKPSPTTAQHVYTDLNGRLGCIIDGGACQVGVESTVVDPLSQPPMVLRPGGVTFEQLKEVMPSVVLYKKNSNEAMEAKPPTPGLKYRHYSPNAKVVLFDGANVKMMQDKLIEEMQCVLRDETSTIGLLHTHPGSITIPKTITQSTKFQIITLGDGKTPGDVAHGLFNALREFDANGVHVIFVEGISEIKEGLAVMNRIRKAASRTIACV